MIYLLPLIAGFFLIFLYCLLSDKKEQNFRFFVIFIFFLIIFFIFFDILTNFFLSDIFLIKFNVFLSFTQQWTNILKDISAFLTYTVLGGVFISYVILQRLFNKYFNIKIKSKYRKNFFWKKFFKSKTWLRIKINSKIFILTIFSIFLIIEILNIVFERFFLDYNLDKIDIVAFYLDIIFINIGFIGILAIYLSNFCFKINKQISYIMASWILFSLGLASFLIFKVVLLDYPFISLQDIPDRDILLMKYWFDRYWYYSIPAFSILSSIGLMQLAKKLKNNKFLFNKKILRKGFNLSFVSTLIACFIIFEFYFGRYVLGVYL